MFFIANWFVLFIYQPFLNLLVAIYWALGFFTQEKADMGIAVIIFTVAFRIIWLPISLLSSRSEKERRQISAQISQINKNFRHDPISQKAETKKLLKGNRRILFASTINISLQVIIALMLYRIFAKGLGGEDLHFIYSFMPKVETPFNLTFLGKYDLTHPSIMLNLLQSLTIFIVEILSNLTSPFASSRKDVITTLFLPIISFAIFSALPAGKKLFIITTLCFSIVLMLVKQIIFVYHSLSGKFSNFAQKTAGINPEIQNKTENKK